MGVLNLAHVRHNVIDDATSLGITVTITVYPVGSLTSAGALIGTPTACTIYEDQDGDTTKENPFTATDGVVDFYVAASAVDLRYTGVTITTAAELDVQAAVAINDDGMVQVGQGLADLILIASNYPGANAGVKIQAAHDALPATGGTIDARGFQGAQTIAATVTITKSVTLLLPPPGAATFTNTAAPAFSVSGASGVTLSGGYIVLSGTNACAVKYVGTVSNLTIEGMTVEGDGLVGSAHRAFWNAPGQTLSNIKIIGNTISEVMTGIITTAGTPGGGVLNGVLIEGNHLSDIVGTDPGQGYGIVCSNISANPTNARIVNNFIENASRHSIYVSSGSGVVISGNTIMDHRADTDGSLKRAAITIGRCRGTVVSGNSIVRPRSGAIAVFADEDYDSETGAMVIDGNLIYNAFGFPAISIGNPAPSTSGIVTELVISNNIVWNDVAVMGTPYPILRIESGKRICVTGNSFAIVGVDGDSVSLVDILGMEEGAGTADYTDNLDFKDNFIYGTKTTGTVRGIKWSTLACTSAIRADFISNHVDVPDNAFYFTDTQTDPNIRVFDTLATGLDLTLVSGVRAYPMIVTNTDGSETLTVAQTGALVVCTKSDGTTTITLPNPGATTVGVVYTILQTADRQVDIVPTTANGNSIVADNVATSDKASLATASHLIGAGALVLGISATKWLITAMSPTCPLTVEAAD
jgi:hypothetical protein